MSDLTPAINALLMETASHDHDENAIRGLLAEFDTVDKCAELATTTAQRTAIMTNFIPRPVGPLSAEQLMAIVIVRGCKRGEPIILDTLTPATLSSVAIALLTTWRAACIANAALTLSQRPWEALQSPADALQGRSDA